MNKIINTIPIIIYQNLDDQFNRSMMLNHHKNKSGIYCWRNKNNNKIYVGSAINLSVRLKHYLTPAILTRELLRFNSKMYKAMLKYEPKGFTLYILEYCESSNLIEREQYYLDLLQPEYNILKIANSRLGLKASPETLLKIIGRKHKLETINKMREAKLGKSPSSLAKINQLLAKGNTTILINKQDNSIKQYPSLRKAAESINADHSTLIYCIKNNTLYKNTYFIIRFFKINPDKFFKDII